MSNYTTNKETNSVNSTVQKPSRSQSNSQLLKRSTYNIYEAYDVDMSTNSLLDSSSIHPLQTESPYSMDLSSNTQSTKSDEGDLTHMMKDLDLSTPPSNNIEMRRASAMPYCV